MKNIELTMGYSALVDDDDFDLLSKYNWCVKRHKKTGLAYACNGRIGSMHRFVLRLQNIKGMMVDHINQDGLDNQKCNLRICSHAQNSRNRGCSRNNRIGLKGVCFHKQTGKWRASIMTNGIRKSLGLFHSPQEAADAYAAAASAYHGEFSNIGQPRDIAEAIPSSTAYADRRLCRMPCSRKKQPGCSSSYKGVCYTKSRARWRAYADLGKKRQNIGYFKSEIEAAIAYDNAVRGAEIGSYALNFPD